MKRARAAALAAALLAVMVVPVTPSSASAADTVPCQTLVDEWVAFAAVQDERARNAEAYIETLTYRLDRKRTQIDRLRAKVERLQQR